VRAAEAAVEGKRGGVVVLVAGRVESLACLPRKRGALASVVSVVRLADVPPNYRRSIASRTRLVRIDPNHCSHRKQ
jgi:hypothetical protein